MPLRKNFRSWKKQRGSIILAAFGVPAAVVGDVITLSGHSVSAFSFGSDARAEVKVDNDGNMYERKNAGSWDQIDTTNDWIRPTGSAGSPYRSRYTGRTGDALDGATSQAEDTWQSTASDFFYVQIDTTPSAGGKSSTFTIQVDDGTTVEDSASYTLIADREDF